MKELGNILAEKLDSDISLVTNWSRTKLSFSLNRSAVLCIRSTPTLRRTTLPIDPSDIDTTNAIGRIKCIHIGRLFFLKMKVICEVTAPQFVLI